MSVEYLSGKEHSKRERGLVIVLNPLDNGFSTAGRALA